MKLTLVVLATLGLSAVSLGAIPAQAQTQTKPNILIIWGDDIGGFNISAYNQGMMGFKTPNIDAIHEFRVKRRPEAAPRRRS